MAKSRTNTWISALGRAAAIGFGAYITLTSLVGVVLGVQGGNGWLAILYGTLGMSMGLAGIVGTLVRRPLRSAFLGWFLVGIATRAVLEGDAYLIFVSVPVAGTLLTAFVVELSSRASGNNIAWGLAGAASSIIALAVLAAAAPHLPVICPPGPSAGSARVVLWYPPNVYPWDGIVGLYFERCAEEH